MLSVGACSCVTLLYSDMLVYVNYVGSIVLLYSVVLVYVPVLHYYTVMCWPI